MADEKTVSGRVIDPDTKGGWEGATVRLQYTPSPEEKPASEYPRALAFHDTKADGQFKFDVSDPQAWPLGHYTLWAYHPDSRLGGETRTFELKEEETPQQEIEMVADRHLSGPSGVGLAAGVVFLILVLVGGYVWLHLAFPAPRGNLDEDLAALVKLAKDQAAKSTELTATSPVSMTIATAQTLFESLGDESEQALISVQKEQTVTGLFTQAKAVISSGDTEQLPEVLNALGEAVQGPERWFWEDRPWRFAEIAMWALFATMSRVAIDTSREVVARRFSKRAVLVRLVLLVVVPALAVVMTFLLSLFGFKIAFGESELTLDIDNVECAIVVAALVGLVPWEMWRFLDRLARQLFKKLDDTLGGQVEPPTEGEGPDVPAPDVFVMGPVLEEAAGEPEDEEEGAAPAIPRRTIPDQERRSIEEA